MAIRLQKTKRFIGEAGHDSSVAFVDGRDF